MRLKMLAIRRVSLAAIASLIAVVIRDGTMIHADNYRPTTAGKLPALPEPTLYDKHNADAAASGLRKPLRGQRGE
jgi:predicted acyl esterase